ncbi:Fic family protein [Lewinella sp. 4G2]|uniref:Fic family protein n=1 Tax=Lewinella sp. 4G2 TaxID=1803372 RepID=UPI0007B4C8BE|nr:Fic family protein [Lewinella sp. 4G2]OAV42948.1 hypothetical protein A3850_017145 [Lewinella sp. 4G2]
MDRLLTYDYLSGTAINSLLNKIDAYNKDWKQRERLDADRLRTLRKLATINSIGSSTRIEGSSLSDEEVAKLIDNMDITKLVSRDEQEVAGYYQVLDIILDSYADLELTESLIKGLHNELLRHSNKDQYHRGGYKQHSNRVVATDEAGNTRTIFNTTEVLHTPDAMRNAVQWYHESKGGKLHPLERVFAFVYEFLSIHPFQDGNGRLSRLLTTLLLLQNGYDFVTYYSMEQGIEDRKKDYYKCLMVAQRHRNTKEEEIGRFMHFMLKTLYGITPNLDSNASMVVEEPAALYLNRRMRDVLDFVKDEGELSISQIDALLPVVSRSTIKNDLAKLTESGYLERHGKGRGTVYSRVVR